MRNVSLVGIIIGSIFLAVVISLSLFYFFGLSVNFITISGLAVCFGMVLDNSILGARRGAARAGQASSAAGGARGASA